MPEWKRRFGKFKWGALKITGLALTIGFAFNYTKNEIVREISSTVMPDSVHVRHTVDPKADSLIARLAVAVDRAEAQARARDSVVVRVVTVPRDSLVIRHRLVPRDTLIRRVVWDTLKTEPPEPTHWSLFQGNPSLQ